MSRIEISYTLTQSEFMAAAEAHWKAQGVGTASSVFVGLGVALLGGLIVVPFPWFGWVFLILGAILLTLSGARWWIWCRAFKEARKYTEAIHVVFAEEGIHVDSAEGTSDLNWTFYSSYLDVPDHVLLYMTKRAFSVIPKSAFGGEEDLREFLRLVELRLEPRGKKRWRTASFHLLGAEQHDGS
jgi:hypothetical protein